MQDSSRWYRQVSAESLFETFWKGRREVRKTMVGYALSLLESRKANAKQVSEIICREFKLNNFPHSIVVDIVETEMEDIIDSVDGEFWKFKDSPTKKNSNLMNNIIKKFKNYYIKKYELSTFSLTEDDIEKMIRIFIEILQLEILDKHDSDSISEFIRGKDFNARFISIAGSRLEDEGFIKIDELLATFQYMWEMQDRDLKGYLIDYISSVIRIKSIQLFEETTHEPIQMKDTIIILDANVIFSLCLETNPFHILAESAIKTAINNGLEIQVSNESWGEFRNNLHHWNKKKKGKNGWASQTDYYDNEIIKDFTNSGLKWEDYYKKSLDKYNDVKAMGINITYLPELSEERLKIEDHFYRVMHTFYHDELSLSYEHDILISSYFCKCAKEKKCWVISRHGRLISLINNLFDNFNNGSLHLNQFHGWMVEFLSMNIPKESWQETANSLLTKTILDTNVRKPENLATFISAFFNWKGEPEQLLRVLKNMPKYKTILNYWIKGDRVRFEMSLAEVLDEDLVNSLSKSEEEKEDMRERMNFMRIRFNKLTLNNLIESSRNLVLTTIETLGDNFDSKQINKISKKINKNDPEIIISTIVELTDLLDESNKPIKQRLLNENESLTKIWLKVHKDLSEEQKFL